MNRNDIQCVNSIRLLAVDAIEKANSGHPGLPLGAAPMAYALWKSMRFDPSDPAWINRDRFVLSAGHGSALLYSLLHHFGYAVSLEDMQQFRQLGSKTPGHPEYGHTVGVETTTGPLGQGIANAVGMAVAEAYLGQIFNRPGFPMIDHYTYALAGDGCMMEGISGEAASFAGSMGLGKLIVLYDDNDISIEGNTDITFTEDVGKRFEAYHWQVLDVADGNDLDALEQALNTARANLTQPTLIRVRTTIGFGSPKQGSAAVHGAPLGAEGIRATREAFGWEAEQSFHVPQEVYHYLCGIAKEHSAHNEQWKALSTRYCNEYPQLAEQMVDYYRGKLPQGLLDDAAFTQLKASDSTRNHSGVLLNRMAALLPNLIGGSADLAPSNMTALKGLGDFSATDRTGRNLHYGVREHAMAAIANGISLHGGLRTFAATFFVFSDYMKHAMRLSALMQLPVVYVLTHDSIGVGEDGPTHQPVEQLAMLRSVAGMTVYRPADGNETAAAYVHAFSAQGPTSLVLSRQALPCVSKDAQGALRGGYVLQDCDKQTPDLILLASGSEVQLICAAAEQLRAQGIAVRVVSMPSFEVFNAQDAAYRRAVLPLECRARLAVEAGSAFGWHQYVGLDGDVLCMEGYGASAPAGKLYAQYGFMVENVVARALRLLQG